MILIAVIVGYILGIAPFIAPKIIEIKQNKAEQKINIQETKKQQEIFNEWLNGADVNKDENKVNQEDIYNEYLTGKVSTKGD